MKCKPRWLNCAEKPLCDGANSNPDLFMRELIHRSVFVGTYELFEVPKHRHILRNCSEKKMFMFCFLFQDLFPPVPGILVLGCA